MLIEVLLLLLRTILYEPAPEAGMVKVEAVRAPVLVVEPTDKVPAVMALSTVVVTANVPVPPAIPIV